RNKNEDVKIEFYTAALKRFEFLNKYQIHPHFFGPTAKFYKRLVIENSGLKFDKKLSYGEDNLFNCEFLLKVKYIYLHGQQFYYQRVVEDSLSSARPYLPNDKYKYERLYEVLEKLNLPFDIIEKNIYP